MVSAPTKTGRCKRSQQYLDRKNRRGRFMNLPLLLKYGINTKIVRSGR